MATPPFFELEESWRLGVNISPEVMVLAPKGIGRVKVIKTTDQMAAIEFSTTHVTG
jgi:hypothetical protein